MSDPLVPIVLAGITAVMVDLVVLWVCSRAVKRSPVPTLLLSGIVLLFAGTIIGTKLTRERSTLRSVTSSPDGRYELATYAEKNSSVKGLNWTVYARPRGFRLLARGKFIFSGNNFSTVETQWQNDEALLIRCDCSAGIVWETEPKWAGIPIRLVEVPSVGADHLPIRPKNVPDEAIRVGGEWIVCQTAQSGETWNRCSVYADKTGSLITSGRYRLRQHERPATRDELRYTMYDDNLFNKPEGGWIYLRDGILEAIPLQPESSARKLGSVPVTR